MVRRHIASFDNQVTAVVDSWPRALQPWMRFATLMGEPPVVVFWCAVGAWAAWSANYTAVAFSILSALLASGVNVAFKQFFQRPRPNTLYVANMRFKTHSFPSGHAFAGITVYGLFAYLSVLYLAWPLGLLLGIFVSILSIVVGLSRIYLGAHYPTDVVAGWILGAISLALIVAICQP